MWFIVDQDSIDKLNASLSQLFIISFAINKTLSQQIVLLSYTCVIGKWQKYFDLILEWVSSH